MNYCFDLDNTICDTDGRNYYSSVPRLNVIRKINALYDSGNKIIIMTARGKSSGTNWKPHTESQLKLWNLKYHELVIGVKPDADIFIDDKGINCYEWINQNCPNKRGVTAGCFDILHPGYIRFFDFCKANCNHFTILLHKDPSIERPNKIKPIFSVEERSEVIRSLKYVDSVVVYETEDQLKSLLTNGSYDVRFLGSDYIGNTNITGKDIVPIMYHDRNHKWSYTKVRELCKIV